MNEEDLTNTAVRENKKSERVLKASDIEALKKSVFDELMIMVQREVISMLGYAMSNRQGMVQPIIPKTIDNDDTEEQTFNPIVQQMASLWGADEETEE